MTIDHPRAPETRSSNTFIAIFVCMATGIIIAGILHYRHFEVQYRAEIGRSLSSVAELKAEQVAHYRSEHLTDASLFFNDVSFTDLVRRYFEDPRDLDAEKQIQHLFENMRAMGLYDRVRLLDNRLVTRLSVPVLLTAITQRAAESIRTERADITDFYTDTQDNTIYLSVTVPLIETNRGRRQLGTVILCMNPATHLYPLLQRWPTPSPTAETLLVRRDGNDALFLTPTRFQKDSALKLRIPLSRTDVPAVRAVLGRTGVADGVDYRGVPVLADTRAIPDSPWFLVTRIDISEFKTPLRKQLWMTVIFIGSLLGGAGAALAFVWKQRSAGVYRELLESSEKVNLLLDSAAEAIYGIDSNGNCTFCNSSCLRLLGYTRADELLGKNMHWQIHSKHPDGTPFPIEECRIFQAFRKGEEARVDDEVLWRSDGTSFPAEYWSYPQRRDGAVVGAVVSFLDITERKKASEAVVESEKKFKALFSGARDAIFVINITGDGMPGSYADVNEVACERLGYTREELLKLSPKDIDAPESAAKIPEVMRQLAEKDHVVFEAVHRAKDGRLIPEEISTQRLELNGRQVFLSIARDITERRKVEKELRKLSRAVTESPACIVITDDKGAIEFVNRRFTEVTGYSFEEARGQNPRILKSGAQPPEFYKELWGTISSGEIWRGEFHNKKKNGQLYWESAAIAPITDAGGRITNYLAVKEDITERKRLEAELIKAKDAAEAANRAKSAFLANMSHEIRTPMNAILGFSQLMRRDPAATPKQKQQIETINRSGEHLLALINDILEMSKAEAGHATLNPSAFDLHALIDDVENMLRPRAVAKGLRLEVVRSAGLPRFVTADEGKLRQILLNLLGNALKFTEKGAVALRLAAQPGAEREFQLTAEVEDTGPGISPQELAMLFRPFEQAQAGRAAGGGTGLGLAISREYVRLMGGDVTVKSRPGQGSVFSFNIALKEASQSEATQKNQPRQVKGLKPGQQQYRVLVADDKEDNREFLAQLLEPAGFDVRQAADGAAALIEFETWRPQLILMDLQMPGMDGYEAMRRIRAGAGGKEAKIIVVTASVFGETNLEATGAGADDLILKPFRESELFEKIQNLLGAEYIYEEEAPAAIAGPADTEMLKSALTGLPPELISQLRKAVYNGDFDRLAELAGQVETHNISLAVMLRRLAEDFDMQGILALFAKEIPHDR